jgi:hypothetical protein
MTVVVNLVWNFPANKSAPQLNGSTNRDFEIAEKNHLFPAPYRLFLALRNFSVGAPEIFGHPETVKNTKTKTAIT